MTAAMLDEGAGSRSALELADAVDFLGANLTTGSTFDESVVRLNVPALRLSDALPLMADVALHPTFPAQDLDRLRQERLTALLQARDDPQAISPRAFQRIVFGATHRYGTSATGTESTLKSFTPMDLRAFHDAFYQPSNATLVVVGDIKIDEVVPMLEKSFGAWKNTRAVRRPAVPTAPQLTSGQIHLVEAGRGAVGHSDRVGRCGAVDTRLLQDTSDEHDPRRVVLVVAAQSEFAREHGYAYGAGPVSTCASRQGRLWHAQPSRRTRHRRP
jgi:predicted Zn-dependent peptidase